MDEIKKGYINFGKLFDHEGGVFYLNHSCDEWVIGNLEKAEVFAKDLLALIEKVEDK